MHALLVVAVMLVGSDPSPATKPATSRRLAGAIDQYLKDVEAAERAKAAAGEKLIATYEATIKRAMRAGELKAVEALQAELREVNAELEKAGVIVKQTDGPAAFRAQLVAHPWHLYWDNKRGATDMPVVLKPDGSLIYANVVKTKDWPKVWSVEQRPVLLIAGNVLLLLPNGELRGFFLGTGQPVGAIPAR